MDARKLQADKPDRLVGAARLHPQRAGPNKDGKRDGVCHAGRDVASVGEQG